jgi:hypothetical protein
LVPTTVLHLSLEALMPVPEADLQGKNPLPVEFHPQTQSASDRRVMGAEFERIGLAIQIQVGCPRQGL